MFIEFHRKRFGQEEESSLSLELNDPKKDIQLSFRPIDQITVRETMVS